MLNRTIVALLALLSLSSLTSAQPPRARETSDFRLEIGEQVVVPASGVKSYSEGTPGVVDVRLTGDASRFVVVGMRQGTSTLLCIMLDGSERLYNFQVGEPVSADALEAVSDLTVKPLQNIRLDLYFVQLDRKRSLDYGVQWPTTLGFANLGYEYNIVNALSSRTAVVGTSLAPQLDAAQSRGWAKTTRHVTVITTNGQGASFNSGGEFNTITAAGLTSSVFSVKYGSRLMVTPRYDEQSGRIELKVSAELSDLAATGAPIPGRSISNVDTVSNLALGESLAVAGVVANTASQTKSGVPWLSQIPVIGWLFGKHSNTWNETENLVFISPSVVDPMKPARAREFLSSAMRELEQYTGSHTPRGIFPGTPRTTQPSLTAPPPASTAPRAKR
jgi:pilus assembly protein CpaC